MSYLTLLWKFKSYIGIALIILIVGGYWLSLKYTIKSQAGKLSDDQVNIAQLTEKIVSLQAAISLQNANIDQMKRYADQKDREIADATALSEKLQDDIDSKAQQIINSKTQIEQEFTNLEGCKAELGRIKDYMIKSEEEFKKWQ